MAYYRPDWDEAGKPAFIIRGDVYSVSTSGHQSAVRQACKGPIVSFDALAAAGMNPRTVKLIAYDEDTNKHVRRIRDDEDSPWRWEHRIYDNELGGRWVAWKTPKVGTFAPYPGGHCGDCKEGYWHVLGACLLEDAKGVRWLCSTDEGMYFIAALPGRSRTIQQAFTALIPEPVKRAKQAGIEVQRQGEWFFIKAADSLADMADQLDKTQAAVKQMMRDQYTGAHPNAFGRGFSFPIPDDRKSANDHVCRQFSYGGARYATGSVVHKGQVGRRGYMATGEHRTLQLGDAFWKVYRNTEGASFRSEGRID